MRKKYFLIDLNYSKLFLLFFLWTNFIISQTQSTKIIAKLNFEKKIIEINQNIIFHNYSNDPLKEIYLHNWMNSYKDKNTPLSKRLLEDYDKSLYFAKSKNRGYSKINSIINEHDSIAFKIDESLIDIIKIQLDKTLRPKDSIVLKINYEIKIPADKFTYYGYNKKEINLRYWNLTPVVYDNGWQIMSNYNMDDMYNYLTDYEIEFNTPNKFLLETNLNILKKNKGTAKTTYFLHGTNLTEAEIVLYKKKKFKQLNIESKLITTNFYNAKLDTNLIRPIYKRQIAFIEAFLGKYPHKKIFINQLIYDKNPVYGLNQLPSFLNPFDDLFKYDIQFFKALSNKYINNSLPTNRRNDYWLNDGIQTYLMLKYIEKYYPEKKILGTVSKIWGIRSYKIAQLNFNDKYTFVHQFAMRNNLDQALNVHSDSLSTFNRKIVNKYKAGLGLVYLDDYLNNNIIKNSLKEYYIENKLSTKTKKAFKEIVTSKTSKNLHWFFGDYLKTNKKLDYTINKIETFNDSLLITIKNKSDFNAPITIYGIKNKEIKYKKWVDNIADFKSVKIPKGDFDRVSLNYESKYPEINLNNNWKKIKPSLFNKPLQFRFMKDVDNPYYHQVFYNIEYDYNYYEGVILGLVLTNKTLLKKKWTYSVKPTFGIKNKEINGSFGLKYRKYLKGKINNINSGFSYSTYNYAPDLTYQRLSPYVSVNFKRKSLRDVGGKYISARYLMIKKEVAKDSLALESDNYAVLNLRFGKNKPEIINNLRYNFDFQLADKFSKIAFEIQYRKLRKNNTQIDLRVFAGSFLHNKTTSDFFNYSLNRPSDYLFDYNYFGRSESSGFLSQQIIISEGGFKSLFKNNKANQWMFTTNSSVGVWRWIELYADAGFFKNKNFHPQFKYDSGIRLNFVQNFFEVYLPVQSSNGFELKQEKYPEKIRFVITLSIGKIYNFVKRGFY